MIHVWVVHHNCVIWSMLFLYLLIAFLNIFRERRAFLLFFFELLSFTFYEISIEFWGGKWFFLNKMSGKGFNLNKIKQNLSRNYINMKAIFSSNARNFITKYIQNFKIAFQFSCELSSVTSLFTCEAHDVYIECWF